MAGGSEGPGGWALTLDRMTDAGFDSPSGARRGEGRIRYAVAALRVSTEIVRLLRVSKPERFVQPDGAGVAGEDVQENPFATILYVGDERGHEPRGQPLTPVRRRGADGADLRPAVEPQALAGHRDQRTVAPDPDVPAELDRSLEKRAGLGRANELNHLRHVSRTQRDGLRLVGPAHTLSDHLHELEREGHFQRLGQREAVVKCRGRRSGRNQLDRVLPVGARWLGWQRKERRDVGVIAKRAPAALRKPRVRARQGCVHRVVQSGIVLRKGGFGHGGPGERVRL